MGSGQPRPHTQSSSPVSSPPKKKCSAKWLHRGTALLRGEEAAVPHLKVRPYCGPILAFSSSDIEFDFVLMTSACIYSQYMKYSCKQHLTVGLIEGDHIGPFGFTVIKMCPVCAQFEIMPPTALPS